MALAILATFNAALAAAPLVALPFEKDVGVSSPRYDPVGAGVIEIAAPRPRGGAVVKAEDFGFSETNEYNGAAMQSALAEAKRVGASKVVLKPGTYRCFDKTGVIIDGFEDFVFDGAGAELVFRRAPRYPIEPSWDHDGSGANFVIRNCRRVKVGNMVTDWDWRKMPLATCAKVAATHVDDADNKSYIDYDLLGCGARHPYYGKIFPFQRTQPMTEDFRRFAHGPNIWHGTYEGEMGCRTLWLSPTRVRVYPFVEEPGRARWTGPNKREFSPKLNRDSVRQHKVGETYRIAHAYYGKGGFTLVSNEDFELHDIEIPACFGHAVYVGGTQKNWRIKNVTVAPRDWRHPISSSADTIHFVRSHGSAVIDNLTVKLEQDDAINVHDRFTVAKRIAPRTLQVVLERGARYFRPGEGNVVELLDPGYNETGWKGKCVGNDGETILVDHDLPASNPEEGYFLVFDRTASSDGIIIRNCTFEDMEMRTLVNASNATIEDCVFRRTNGDPLRCIADYTLKWWAEGMGTTNVVVRNCRFEGNCVRELVGSYYSLGADFVTWLGCPKQVKPERLNRRFISDILVEDCEFVDSLGYFADLRFGTGLTFRNNRIVLTGKRDRCRENSGFARVERVTDVTFEGNVFERPDGAPAPCVEVAEDVKNLVLKGNRLEPSVVVEVQKVDETVEPVPMMERFDYEAKDGLLLRNGKPFFWTSDGSSLGGVHSTPLGLWLSRLHGASLVSMPHSSCVVRGAERTDGIHLSATLDESYFSWLRESIRLGFLVQAPEGFFHPAQSGSLPPLLSKHPNLLESIYDHGHYMGADPGSDLGLDLLDAKRSSLFTYGGKTGFFMPELNREPGPDPYNNRVKEGFRRWAERKYGTLDEANAIWRTAFRTWGEVTLPHTTGACVTDASSYAKPGWQANLPIVRDIRNKRAAMRAKEKRETPEMYWDWMLYVQEDTTAATRREFEHARKFAPAALFGMDVRGHQSARDNYAAYDPIAIDAMADIFYIHSSGFKCYDYGRRPFEPNTLHDAICWPLFTCRYFRCNTTKPIVNSEDIIEDVISAAPSEEAMKANDLAKLCERQYNSWERPDGKKVLSCNFNLAAILENDRSDGSKRFYVAGRAPAAFNILLNGKYLGRAAAKGAFFKYDVTNAIKFGDSEKNVITLSFEKGEETPTDPGCRILTQDTLGRPGVYGKKHYKSQYWSYLTGGQSAAIVWHWNKSERLRLYQAAIAKKLAAAAEIVLPAVRFKKEKVAFLYSYVAGAGLPASQESHHHELMDWAGALEFTGHRFDVLGEERFRKVAADYPVIVAPDIWCAFDETVEAAKEYVRRGGILVVTPGSLGKTFSRYRDSGFAAFASGDTGRGRVVVLDKGWDMKTLAGRLAPILPAPELNVEIAPSDEFPCVERMLVGDAARKVLYMQNWGGLDQTCRVMLPEEMRGWKLTRMEGEFIRTSDGVETTVEGSQGVAVCILSAPGAEVPDFKLSDAEKKKIRYVQNLMQFNHPAPGKKRVLFALDGPEPGGVVNPYARHPYTGVELFPHEIEAVRALGAEVDAIHPMAWTPELISQYAAVVVTEGNSLDYWQALFGKPAFRKMLSDYVQGGGALLAEIYTGRSLNANMSFFALGKEAWGVEIPWTKNPPRDATSCGFGDPRQILTDAVGTHPIAEGVGKVQLFALTPLKFSDDSRMEKVVSLPKTSSMAGACAVAAQSFGKGRVVVSADPMSFQPYRILEADNASLLLNTLGWLLGEPVTSASRATFKDQCRILE